MTWLRRVRGAFGLGLLWAVAWGLGGLVIGLASLAFPFLPWEAFFSVFDAPLPALALPGFVGGAVFSVVLGTLARDRRFDELSVSRFALWGALGGLALAVVPFLIGVVGLIGPATHAVLPLLVIVGPFAALGAASASASLLLARRGDDPSQQQRSLPREHGSPRD